MASVLLRWQDVKELLTWLGGTILSSSPLHSKRFFSPASAYGKRRMTSQAQCFARPSARGKQILLRKCQAHNQLRLTWKKAVAVFQVSRELMGERSLYNAFSSGYGLEVACLISA